MKADREIPEWGKNEIDKRLKKIEDGTAKFYTWDAAMKIINDE